MNKKGQMAAIGLIMIVFVTILVGVIIFQQIAQTIGTTTDTYSYNSTTTFPQNGSSIYITDIRALSSPVLINGSTTADVVTAANYTVTNNVVYNGALSVMITSTADTTSGWNGTTVYVTGTAQPLTYIDDSGGRGVTTIILIFLALAIAIVAMYPVYQDPNFRAMLGVGK